MLEFYVIAAFLVVSCGFVWAALTAGKLVRPRTIDPDKLATYECGERPFHKAWFNYNPRFYIFALVFIVFDVAIVIIVPPLSIFKSTVASGQYLVPLLGVVGFIAVVTAPLLYLWKRGDLEWIRKE
jgi:NADH-quinone oxidoreductase subunit A